MKKNRALVLAAAALFLASCNPDGSSPVLPSGADSNCGNPNEMIQSGISPATHHKTAVQVTGKDTTLAGIQWAKGDSVRAFFGDKEVKLVFVINKSMYLVTYATGEAAVTRISQNDEGLYGAPGSINSPLFSPDGRKIVYAGTTRGKPAFVLDAVPAGVPAWRVPLDPKGHVTADPHWYVENGKTYVYFATLSGLVTYSDKCSQIPGGTYRRELLDDKTLDSARITGIAGAYRGGISKDGLWAGTSYASSALFDKALGETHLLAGGAQQCNPSMNPYPAGSKHNDYMMILAFGGKPAYKLIDSTEFTEGLHENLWIYNRNNRAVWQGKRPDETVYLRYDKPEWSTHPDYATAVVLLKDVDDGDLFVVKIGDLANADEGKLNQAEGYLRLGKGGFNSDSFSHLWVAP